jgi:hypothetical protein
MTHKPSRCVDPTSAERDCVKCPSDARNVADRQPRWRVDMYESGSTNVAREPDEPFLGVYVPGEDIDDPRYRVGACKALAAFLNSDGPCPAWLDDMERYGERMLRGTDGSFVRATGPMYDSEPPKCNWKEREDHAAKDARARLIDTLCGLRQRG